MTVLQVLCRPPEKAIELGSCIQLISKTLFNMKEVFTPKIGKPLKRS